MADREFLSRLGGLLDRAQHNGVSPDDLRRAYMLRQMRDAQDVSEAVPRGLPAPPPFTWSPPAIPELPSKYQPPERWNYGRPVRLA